MSDQQDQREKRGFPWVAVFFASLPVFYVLSYAPVVAYSDGMVSSGRINQIAFYKPADWLIDNTPLRRPLMVWAGLNGVRQEFERSSLVRRLLTDLNKHP